MKRIGLVIVMVGMVLAAGCKPGASTSGGSAVASGESGTPQSGLRTTTMKIGRKTFTLEIAASGQEHQTGLMYRDSMPADHGMIFVFGSEQPRTFWMKHTRLPLDIVYVDAQGKVVSVHQMQPFDLSGITSRGAAKYAIELNQGAAAAAGVKEGDQLELPAEVTGLKSDAM